MKKKDVRAIYVNNCGICKLQNIYDNFSRVDGETMISEGGGEDIIFIPDSKIF